MELYRIHRNGEPVMHIAGNQGFPKHGWRFMVYTKKEGCEQECRWFSEKVHDMQTFEPVKLVTSGIPNDAICYFKDGDSICCVFGDFQNMQESLCGFGGTHEEAREALSSELAKELNGGERTERRG